MKRVAIAVALAACGHKAPPTGPEHDLDTAHAAAATIDAGAPATPLAAPVPALAEDGPHAFIADDDGLVEVAPSGKAQTIVPAKPSWCSADARAQVVWFAGDGGLYAFDLTDRRTHLIVRGDVQADTFMIDWGDQHLGGDDKVDYGVALAVRMSGTPKVSSELGCDGDRAVYCYAEDLKTLNPDVADQVHKVDALALADPAYVAAVAARGAHGSIWTPPPAPPPMPKAKPRVDKHACEEPDTCGNLIAIPGSPLWLVVTGNSRGDFYHESRELWDPRTGEYVGLDHGALVRSKKPRGTDSEYDDLRVAPDGTLSIDGAVFDATHVVFTPKGDLATTCGWSTGGWRIAGPREQ